MDLEESLQQPPVAQEEPGERADDHADNDGDGESEFPGFHSVDEVHAEQRCNERG